MSRYSFVRVTEVTYHATLHLDAGKTLVEVSSHTPTAVIHAAEALRTTTEYGIDPEEEVIEEIDFHTAISEVLTYLENGEKVKAIKRLRELGAGELITSKRLVDRILDVGLNPDARVARSAEEVQF